MTTPAMGSNRLWVAHGGAEAPIPMHIVVTMAAGAHHSGGDVHIQIILFTVKSESHPLAAMAGRQVFISRAFFLLNTDFARFFARWHWSQLFTWQL
jgi:hypothetical protein